MSAKAKRPPLGKIKSWSAGLGAKLSGNGSTDPDLLAQTGDDEQTSSEIYSTDAYRSDPALSNGAPDVGTPKGKSPKAVRNGLPDASAYEASLDAVEEANEQLVLLQAALAKETSGIFVDRLAYARVTLDAYTTSMQALDNAAARLEAIQSRSQKSKSDKRELEDDLRSAKAAHEEALADAETRAEALADSRQADRECLAAYMQVQLKYVAQAKSVLDQVHSLWGDTGTESRFSAFTSRARSRTLTSSKILLPSLPRLMSAKEASDTLTPTQSASNSSLNLAALDTSLPAEDDSKEKKSRLRMPTFTGASDTVASMASGIGTFSRSKSSMFSSIAAADTSSPERERSESGKWTFMGRKKEQGFKNMDESERLSFSANLEPSSFESDDRPRRLGLNRSVSSKEVHLGQHDDHHRPSLPHSPVFRQDDTSPFDQLYGHTAAPLSTANFDHIHERGGSQMSSDVPLSNGDYLGVSHHGGLALNHTGQSAYSDNTDPFASSALSPQSTGQPPYSSDDDDYERVTDGSAHASPFAAASQRGPPPPIPSSASYLSKSKGRPPPPPLPSRPTNS